MHKLLKKITTVYYHAGCPDGIASREIHRKFAYLMDFGPIEYLPFVYPGPLPKDMKPNTLYVDCCPRDAEGISVTLDLGGIILDHHDSRKELLLSMKEKYPDQVVYGENSKCESGATLTFKAMLSLFQEYCQEKGLSLFFSTEKLIFSMERYATLTAISDTWHTESPEFSRSRALAHYIFLQGDDWDGIPSELDINMSVSIYGSYLKKLEREADRIYTIDLSWMPWASDGGGAFKIGFMCGDNTSDIAEILRNRGYDLVVGFAITMAGDKPVLRYSLRSSNKLDVSKFCVKYGGGGHKAAAGMTLDYIGQHPIYYFVELLQEN